MIYIGITRRSDSGKWRCFWTEHGKRKVSKDCDTEEQVKNLQAVLTRKYNPELYKGPVDASWQYVVGEYKDAKEDRLSNGGYAEVARTLDRFEKVCSPAAVNHIGSSDINKFIKHRKKTVVSETINKDLTNLITFFNWCVKNNYLEKVPYIEKIPTEEKDIFVMTDKQCAKLLETAKATSLRFYQICKIGLITGQRINDILTLSLKQCDFEKNIITFRPKKTKRTGKRKILVPVKKQYMDEIATWFADGRRWLFFDTDPTGKQTSLLFYGKEQDEFRDMFKRAEIELPHGLLTHVFRHTVSTRLARISVPLAMKITGWVDATRFIKRYVNPHFQDLQQAQEELDL
jgi:integrase